MEEDDESYAAFAVQYTDTTLGRNKKAVADVDYVRSRSGAAIHHSRGAGGASITVLYVPHILLRNTQNQYGSQRVSIFICGEISSVRSDFNPFNLPGAEAPIGIVQGDIFRTLLSILKSDFVSRLLGNGTV